MTAEMSIRIGILTGTSPESWLYNQVQWDLWRESQKPLPKIEPLRLPMAA
jgi:plasmid maintenance system antidote protein VapI